MNEVFLLRYCDVVVSSFEKWYNIILKLLFTDSDYWRIAYWIVITFILVVVYLLFNKSRFSKFVSSNLLLLSVMIWFFGFVLYIIGYPFEKLSEYTQSFDCNVVNTTIKLEYQKKKEIMKMISAILTLECEDDGLNALKSDILADMNNVVQYLQGKI